MFKLSSFILFCIGAICLFTQCQEATTTTEQVSEKVAETVEKPVEQVKAILPKVDSLKAMAISKTEETKTEKPELEKEKITNEKVLASKAPAEDRKKEPEAPKKKKKKVKKRPKIKFEQTTHKFGTIKTGDKVNHTFKFKNTGNAPLVIKSVDVTCGCTFPSYPFLPIEPGEEGQIDVNFDSKGKIGSQKPTVTVVTNARPRTLKLYMVGNVE